MSGLNRSTSRSSSGKTLYLLASSRGKPLQLGQLVGLGGGQVIGLGQSPGPYSSHTSSSNAGSSAPKAHGVLWRVTAVQP